MGPLYAELSSQMGSPEKYCPEGFDPMKPNQFAHFIAPSPAPDLRPVFAPERAELPDPPPGLKTFADVDDLIARHPDWPKGDRGPARSTSRGIAARIQAIRAAERNEPFNPDPKKLDL